MYFIFLISTVSQSVFILESISCVKNKHLTYFSVKNMALKVLEFKNAFTSFKKNNKTPFILKTSCFILNLNYLQYWYLHIKYKQNKVTYNTNNINYKSSTLK